MRCIFCQTQTGCFKNYHGECYQKVQVILQRMESIINQYNHSAVNAKDAKKKLLHLAESDFRYKNYLEREIFDKTAVRTNETIVYVESGICIWESKNCCRMVETGHRYEKMPVWKELNFPIGNNASVVLTDKSIYLLLPGTAKRYPYDKIVNLGFDEKWQYAYFDLKTSSPYPHRLSICSFKRKEKRKAENVCLFLRCMTGY